MPLCAHIDLQTPVPGCVAYGVVQQVAGQLAQHPFMGGHAAGLGFDAEVHVVIGNQRR